MHLFECVSPSVHYCFPVQYLKCSVHSNSLLPPLWPCSHCPRRGGAPPRHHRAYLRLTDLVLKYCYTGGLVTESALHMANHAACLAIGWLVPVVPLA